MRDFVEPVLPEKIDTIKIQSIPQYDISDYDLNNPKELNQYFKSIEKICRNSRCYKKLIDFLREEVDMNKCSFYKNVNNIDTYAMKIHIHHSPLTLFDIVTTVYNKRLVNHESLTEIMVAKEVMWLHYNLLVGLIPLSETIHGLVHNGLLFIPTNKVFGMYKQFVNLYQQYMDPDLKRTLERIEQVSEHYILNTKILEIEPVYIDPTGSYSFPNIEQLSQELSDKVHEMDKNILEKQFNIEDKDSLLNKVGEDIDTI